MDKKREMEKRLKELKEIVKKRNDKKIEDKEKKKENHPEKEMN